MGSQRRLPARQALVALALAITACSRERPPAPVDAAPDACASEVAAGESRVEVGDRWYLRHVPANHGSAPIPLVVDLHGYSEGAAVHAEATGWGAYGDAHGFVTVTPHGADDPPQWDLDVDGDDVAFVDDVLDDVEDSLCIDPERIYVTGHSMGGFLISTLACSPVAARVAAFAPVAGVRAVPGCTPPRPVPALVIHATGDRTVLYDGGLAPIAAELLGLPAVGPSIPAIVDEWHARDQAADVRLRAIEGGSHEWPRSANDWVWEFFELHAAGA